jgi:hypothetical protein
VTNGKIHVVQIPRAIFKMNRCQRRETQIHPTENKKAGRIANGEASGTKAQKPRAAALKKEGNPPDEWEVFDLNVLTLPRLRGGEIGNQSVHNVEFIKKSAFVKHF